VWEDVSIPEMSNCSWGAASGVSWGAIAAEFTNTEPILQCFDAEKMPSKPTASPLPSIDWDPLDEPLGPGGGPRKADGSTYSPNFKGWSKLPAAMMKRLVEEEKALDAEKAERDAAYARRLASGRKLRRGV
jgi:hypothetical protein